MPLGCYDTADFLDHKARCAPVDLKCQTCGTVHAHEIQSSLRWDRDAWGEMFRYVTVQPGVMTDSGRIRPTCGEPRSQRFPLRHADNLRMHKF